MGPSPTDAGTPNGAEPSTNNGASTADLSPVPAGFRKHSAGSMVASIDAATGNVIQAVTDYETAGPNRLSLTRYYNSQAPVATFASSLGQHWRTNYDRYLNINPAFLAAYIVNGSTANILAERPDGSQMIFSLVGTPWTTDAFNDATLAVSGQTYTLTLHDDSIETYQAVGAEAKLASVRYRGGYTQTLTYDTNGQLATVTDSYGRTLSFTYSNGLLVQVTTPDSLVLTYSLLSSSASSNAVSFLTAVSYNTTPSDQPALPLRRSFFPLRPHLRHRRERSTYASWTYDQYGRALTSQYGSGASLTTITYNDGTDGSRLITNSLGMRETYSFTNFSGVPRLAQILRSGQNFSLISTYAYDFSGFLTKVVDWDSHVTTFTNDPHGIRPSLRRARVHRPPEPPRLPMTPSGCICPKPWSRRASPPITPTTQMAIR